MVVAKIILVVASIGNILALLIWERNFSKFVKVNEERLVEEVMPELRRYLLVGIVLTIVTIIIGVVSIGMKFFMF